LENKTIPNNIIITKLTALWALNESGLGGLMFALHIPLTGFFVGGFAVILISLIAFYSRNSFRQIIQATVLVLVVKATASPHSPPPAYLAVAFQGITGAAIFSLIRNHKLAALLLAVLAMAESSLQKVLVMTIIYGKSIWVALDKSVEGISKDFGINTQITYSLWIIGIYVAAHVFWGVLIGLFAGHLPELIDRHTPSVLDRYQQVSIPESPGLSAPQKKRNWFWLKFSLILILVVAILFFSGAYSNYKIWYVIFRSVAAVLLLFFVLRPILTWLIQYWLKRRSSTTKAQAAEIMTMMPGLKNYVKPAWQMAKTNPDKTGKLRYFILTMIILSLYGK
jgi:hypothetical protein